MNPSLSRGGRPKARQKPNPRRLFFVWLAFMLMSVGVYAVVLAFTVVPFDRSAYTQAHGLLRSGVVTSVANHEGKADSADVGIRLARPVAGQATTTAHVPALVSLSHGSVVKVLVDPQDPGYAELPRRPYIPKSSAQVAVIVGLASIAVSVSGTVGSAWKWRRRHRAQAQPVAPFSSVPRSS